jgi:hexosaminidase
MDKKHNKVIPALISAVIGWSPSSVRSWKDYKIRLGNQGERFKAMNINFYLSKQVPWKGAE